MSYKVWVLNAGENTYATNSLEFKTVEEAKAYGRDLFSRWLSLKEWAVLPVDKKFTGFLPINVVESNKI